MDYVISILVNFFLYISIPMAIRYIIYRKAIESKWIAIGILIPIFIGFSILINIQRDEGQGRIYQGLNAPYKPRPHMIGSPILYVAMALSYGILRRRNKISEATKNEPVQQLAETKNKSLVCSNCTTEILINSSYCHKCGSKTQPPPLMVSEVSPSPKLPPPTNNMKNTDDTLFKGVSLGCLVVVLMVAVVVGLIFVSSIYDSGKNSNLSTNNKVIGDKTQAGQEYDKSTSFVIVDACNDNDKIQFRFYDVTNNLVYPSNDKVYIAENYNFDYTNKLACKDGSIICYGAKSVNGKYSWGAGLDNAGNYDINNDCIPCGSSNVLIKRLSCD